MFALRSSGFTLFSFFDPVPAQFPAYIATLNKMYYNSTTVVT